MQTITPPTTDFDRGTMSAAALSGEELFQGKAACVACHGGPDFTENRKRDTFVPQRPGDTDPGASAARRYLVSAQSADKGAGSRTSARPRSTRRRCAATVLRTPPRTCTTAFFTTLAAVVSFYNTQSSIAPLQLTVDEQADLVAYLEAL